MPQKGYKQTKEHNKYIQKAIIDSKRKKITKEDKRYVQNTVLSSMSICHLVEPPEGMGASVDCIMERDLYKDGTKIRLEHKAILPERYQRAMPHIERGKLILESVAFEQGHNSPCIDISPLQLGKEMGYKNEGDARKIGWEVIDYLRSVEIVTNVHAVRKNKNAKYKSRYKIINRIEELEYTIKNTDGTISYCKRVNSVWVDPIIYKIWMEEKTMNYLPLGHSALDSISNRELALYLFIFNEMLGHPKWNFSISDIKQRVCIYTDDEKKVRRTIRELMNGLKKKELGIKDYKLTDKILTVMGKLKSIQKKKETVSQKKLTEGLQGKMKELLANGDEAKAYLVKIGYQPTSAIPDLIKRKGSRIIAMGKYLDKEELWTTEHINGGWLYKRLGEGKYKPIIGDWDDAWCDVFPESGFNYDMRSKETLREVATDGVEETRKKHGTKREDYIIYLFGISYKTKEEEPKKRTKQSIEKEIKEQEAKLAKVIKTGGRVDRKGKGHYIRVIKELEEELKK